MYVEVFIRFTEIFSWEGNMIKRILNIAIPNGLENGIVQLGRVLLVSIISMFSTAQIAANGITNSLVGIAISFVIFLWPAAFTLPSGLRAAGDVRFTMIVSICSMFILRIALGYILGILFNTGLLVYGLLWGLIGCFVLLYTLLDLKVEDGKNLRLYNLDK